MNTAHERRTSLRIRPEHSRWPRAAIVRPGQAVQILDLSAGGALLESAEPMKPGARIELQLHGPDRCAMRARVDRCRVSQLEPLRYEAAVIFEGRLAVVAGSE